MLGRYLKDYLSDFFNSMGIVDRKDFDVEKNTFAELKSVVNIDYLTDQDVLINCVGLLPHRFNRSSLSKGQYDDEAYKKFILINSIFPHQLEKIHLISNCNVINITSDCVYTGDKGEYSEKDAPDYNWVYGVTKAVGECSEICNIRSSIIGEEKYNKQSLLEWVVSQKDKAINGYDNYLWNGVTCLQMAKIIKEIVHRKLYWKGTRHILSPDKVSKYDLCCMINEAYDLNIEVNTFSLDSKIDRSLSSIYQNFMEIPSIKTQIEETQAYVFKDE